MQLELLAVAQSSAQRQLLPVVVAVAIERPRQQLVQALLDQPVVRVSQELPPDTPVIGWTSAVAVYLARLSHMSATGSASVQCGLFAQVASLNCIPLFHRRNVCVLSNVTSYN